MLDEIAGASGDVQEDFYRLMYELTKHPKRQRTGALPMKDATPNGWSAPFDHALLYYQVLKDHPRIDLLSIRWNVPPANA